MLKGIRLFVSGLVLTSALCAQAPSITTTSPLPNGGVGFTYNFPFGASGGTQPYSWLQISGTLPNGITLSQQGVLSGTFTTPGTFNFTVKVKDLDGLTAS